VKGNCPFLARLLDHPSMQSLLRSVLDRLEELRRARQFATDPRLTSGYDWQ